MKAPRLLPLTGILVLALAVATAAQNPAPPSPSNLQVLDKAMSRRDLVEVMKGFTRGLGVRCQHCHVYRGADPDDLTQFDFANDDKTEKKTARVMMRMTATINHDLLQGVGDAANPTRVTCFTCHRGERRPLTARPPAPGPTAG